jgi:hypothetical protein
MSEKMTSCIEICLACYKTRLSIATNHCLEMARMHLYATCSTIASGTEPVYAHQARAFQNQV